MYAFVYTKANQHMHSVITKKKKTYQQQQQQC